jgi:hypothetical protein
MQTQLDEASPGQRADAAVKRAVERILALVAERESEMERWNQAMLRSKAEPATTPADAATPMQPQVEAQSGKQMDPSAPSARVPNKIDLYIENAALALQGAKVARLKDQQLEDCCRDLLTTLYEIRYAAADQAGPMPPPPLEEEAHAVPAHRRDPCAALNAVVPRPSRPRDPVPGEGDMRLIERTASGGYRCTLRRGKNRERLIPKVFETAAQARKARDGVERRLRRDAVLRKRYGDRWALPARAGR